MSTTRKTKKTAKSASRSTSKTSKARSSMPKATSRSKTKAARTAAPAPARAAKSKSSATQKVASAAKARSVARSAAREDVKTSRVKTANGKAAAQKSKSSVKSIAVKAAAKKAAEAKAAAAKAVAAAKSAKAKAKAVQKIDQKAKKPVETRVSAVKEASPEQSKSAINQKATKTTQTNPTMKLKPVESTGAHAQTTPPKPAQAKASDIKTVAPQPSKTAPDSRPASLAPAVQPRTTSDQTPVTQKKQQTPVPAAKPIKAAPKPVETPPVAPVAKPAKPTGVKLGFKTNEHIVYPAHGVGQIVAIEEQEVAGFKLELFVISFVKDKMTLKVPTPKVVSVGMRKLAEAPVIARSLETLTGRARIKRTMWSRRAQEYEAKINSGDLIAIAEVVRDLYRSEAQPEQSYSERQLYEAALDRMSRELAVVQKLTEQESLKVIETHLQKGPRRGAKVETETDAEVDAGEVDEAA
ncbi:MAG: CarD family transcriptional regulator [Hyphomicrobiales bacterium]|nr:CarD family transcriptional regulator [Hyphomicrobiales bacterium]